MTVHLSKFIELYTKSISFTESEVYLNKSDFKNKIIKFYFNFLIVVQVQLSPFSCHHFPHPTHAHLPPSVLPCFGFVHGPFIDVPWQRFPFFLLWSSSPIPSVSLFFISMSLVLFCLLVCFFYWVPLIGGIIWYLSFSTWLSSLSIMLSSSTHAVTKSRSSFFYPAVLYSIV